MSTAVGVALLGVGTVGSAVARQLVEEPDLLAARAGGEVRLVAAAARDTTKDRGVAIPAGLLGDDPAAAAAHPGAAVVVELLGGLEPATPLIERALREGRSVVTANKAVVARHGPRLAALAAASGAGLWFEAAVAGAIPVIALLGASLLGERLLRLDGVVNGTANFVLDSVDEHGLAPAEALEEARRRGYAEADPSADLDGRDAADKLSILAWLAFGRHAPPESIARRPAALPGETDIRCAREIGFAVRQLATAVRDGERLRLDVRPCLLPAEHPLASLPGAENGLTLEGELAGRLTLLGTGAGGRATSSAVVADIVAAVRSRRAGTPGGSAAAPGGVGTAVPELLDDEEAETAAYLRLELAPDPEAAAAAVQALEDRGVPVEEARRRGADLVVLTAAAPRAVIGRAADTLDSLPSVAAVRCRLDRAGGSP